MAVLGLQQVVVSTEREGSVLKKKEATNGGGFFVDNPRRLFPSDCHIMIVQAQPALTTVIAAFLPSTIM